MSIILANLQFDITIAYAEHSHSPQLSVSDHREYLPVCKYHFQFADMRLHDTSA